MDEVEALRELADYLEEKAFEITVAVDSLRESLKALRASGILLEGEAEPLENIVLPFVRKPLEHPQD